MEHKIRLTFEGRDPLEIACREDEDVVAAGLRQGVLLVSDCREGVCGACRGFLEEGRYDSLLDHSPHALSDRDEEDGWTLACRLQPRSDLHLDFDYPADRVGRLDAGRRSGRIVALDRLSSSVVRLVVRTLGAQEPLRWKAGQHVRLHLPDAGITRAYSVANVADQGWDLEFYVRLVAGGAFSTALEHMPGAGAPVVVEGPFGAFTLRPERPSSVFVAGGTGLAPVLAMLRQLAVDDPQHAATLIFGVGSEEGLFAQAEIAALSAACSRLKTCITVAAPSPSWAGPRGTAADALTSHLAESSRPADSQYYVSGPVPMVEAACAVMAQFGVPSGAIHRENFVPSGVLS